MSEQSNKKPKEQKAAKKERKQYLRFGAMIATAMVVMYAVTYANTYQLSHVEWSETRFFMVLLMGSTMAIVMLAYMLGMYKNTKINIGIVGCSILVFIVGVFLVRSQNTVEDRSYMSAMIPHHSIAILTSENAEIKDVRVCELAVEIIQAQQREISEMKWLLADINKNGPVTSLVEAEKRKVPEFEGAATRECLR